MAVAGERVEHQHGIGAVRLPAAPGLEGQPHTGQFASRSNGSGFSRTCH